MVYKAVVVDKDYGSVSYEELQRVKEAYAAAGIELELAHYVTEDEIIEGCRGAVAILGTGNPPITPKVMEALPEVKELADVATAMIMGLTRNTADYDREIRKGGWPKCKYLMPGDVREMTLGLYGFGGAGRHLHDIFHNGFGTKVISCDPYVSGAVKEQYPDVEFVDFDTLLERSDIISIHVILTPETTHVFNKDAFRKMKEKAMIINTSRGPVIDQKALAWALETGEIRYAGLDTMEQEPISPDDPLLKMDNVILNPHSGSYGTGSKKTQINMVCDLLPTAFTKGELPARCVANKAVLKENLGIKLI